MPVLPEIGLFIASVLLVTLWFSVIILPVFYAFPRALYWAMRGWAKWRGALAYLIGPLVWTIIFSGVAIALTFLTPSVTGYLRRSPGFNIGQTFGVIIALGRVVFSRSARLDISSDFSNLMSPYLTPRGEARTFRSKPT
jgi:hypothetical protein